MFLYSCYVFYFDYGFTHMNHIWPDRKFNGESNGSCCEMIGVTTIKFIKGLHVSLPKSYFHG